MAGKYNHEAHTRLIAEYKKVLHDKKMDSAKADADLFYKEHSWPEPEGPPEPTVAKFQRILGAVCVDYNKLDAVKWQDDKRLADSKDDPSWIRLALSTLPFDNIASAIKKAIFSSTEEGTRKWTAQAVRLAWMVEPNFVVGLANKAPRSLAVIMEGAPPTTNVETGTTIPGFVNTWRQWIDSCLIYKFNKKDYESGKDKQLQEGQGQRAPGGKVPFVSSFDRGRSPGSAARRWP